jgi:hypothetical protein
MKTRTLPVKKMLVYWKSEIIIPFVRFRFGSHFTPDRNKVVILFSPKSCVKPNLHEGNPERCKTKIA